MANKDLILRVMFTTKDQLSGPMKNIVGLGQSGSQKLAAMKQEARDLARELKAVQGETKRSTGNVTGLINRERDLADQIARTNEKMERQARLNNINSRASAIQQAGADLRSSGTSNMITGVAMAAPGVLAAKQAISMESAMADVRKVVDFENPQQFQKMSDDLVTLSTKIPMAAEGLAQIVAEAGRAGVARGELLAFAEDAAKMGVAFDTTAEEAGGMMAKWRTAFAMGQDDVRALSDKINALTNTYGGNVAAVSGIVTRIGALGGVSGVAADEIAAMGQVMSAVGVEEEVAATGIKNFMLAMTKGGAATKSQSKAFAALGLDAVKVSEAMQKDAGGAIDDILRRIAKLPKAQQSSMLTQLFGSESVSAIAPMLTNLDQLQKNFQMIGDKSQYAGSMNAEFLAAINKTEGALGLAKNAATAINIELGNVLLPIITAASHKFVEIAGNVRAWMKENPGLTQGLVMIYGAVVGLVTGLGALKFGLGLLLGPFGTVFRLIATNGPMLVSIFGFIKGAAIAVAGALGLPVWAIAAIAAALGVAGYLIYKHWDTISTTFMDAVAKIKGWFSGLPEWFRSMGSNLMQGLLNVLSPTALANRLIDIARRGVTAFKNFFGIKSPSRLMMSMGGYITDGLASGIDDGRGAPIRAARVMAAGVAGASMATASFAAPSQMAPRSAYSSQAGAGAAPMQIGNISITINAAPGQNAQEIAAAVQAALQAEAAKAAAAKRSSYRDDD
ncbi:MAG: phage tail tape measure protein [Sphingobium sp.]|nr:phage tail tape measure protein [Sphingobium sp.]